MRTITAHAITWYHQILLPSQTVVPANNALELTACRVAKHGQFSYLQCYRWSCYR